MARFAYKARNISGGLVEGVLEADSDRALSARLSAEGLFPTVVRPELAVARPAASRPPRRSDVTQFVSELAELLDAGVPVLDAVSSVADHTPRADTQAMLSSMKTSLSEGAPLSAAMSAHPRAFSPLEVSLVAAAQKGGFLPTALARLAVQREYLAEVRSTVITALAYPSFLVIVLATVVTVLVTFIVPRFESIFDDMGASLPLPTLILISVSRFANLHWYLIFAAAVGVVVTLVSLSRREKWRRRAEKVALSLPIVSDVIVRLAASRFAHSLSLLLSGGVTVSDALSLAGRTTGFYAFRASVDGALVRIRDGARVSDSLKDSGFLSPSQIEIIAVAEKAGDLPPALGRIAEKADKAASVTIKRALAILEPALIVVMAVVVGYVVLSLLVPIFSISAAVR